MDGREEDFVARELHVSGLVQGVGFRPFVYRLATELELGGWVLNDGEGVRIRLEGTKESLERFTRRLKEELPPLARIDTLESSPREREDHESFEIILSDASTRKETPVSPDVTVCDACLREMNDPADRRFGYPFITCTESRTSATLFL